MSGDKNTSPDPYTQAQAQNGTLDAVMQTGKVLNPFGGASMRGIHFGRTSFEGYDLNDMIDIVESAKPELLEAAGTALVAARDAIKAAAEELKGNLPGIDWQGEAHSAFDRWAQSLVKTAEGVGDYADVIGTQVLAAGAGLAQVRASMPPRDTRSERKTVDDIPESKRVESNEEYAAALKAEKNRQEAINQMYRLASFYTVSAGYMQQAEEPVFPKMPDVGVPPPVNGVDGGVPRNESGSLAPSEALAPTGRGRAVTGAGAHGPDADLPVPNAVDALAPRPAGTEINSVGTLPPQEAVRPATGTPPTVGGTPAATGAVPPPVAPTGPSPALRGPLGRVTGPGGGPATRMPPSAIPGRAGAPTGAVPPKGPGPMGQGPRPVVHGQGPAPVGGRGADRVAPVGRTVTPGQVVPRGTGPGTRGIVGGMPKPVGPVTGHAAAPKGPGPTGGATGRSTGVVGGRPVTGATPGNAAGRNSSKLPRGTVVGGEVASAPRTSGGQKPTRHGVIGAPPAAPQAQRSSRRAPGNADGVVGMPRTAGQSGSRTPERVGDGGGAQRGDTRNSAAKNGRSRRAERGGDESATGRPD
ncbi:hypothetical protein HCJ93_20430 [Streptomyces sp. SBST2-5]|uniref:Uncharacterized protein n=1 Tax=Streptomyces composti TaxID=2720025 RepID=A0ABX1AAC6_9ACTN|nr:hypothetical protein [Streptomyces composti]NJP52356.1 hypothetical protein [Streptomyces composti]